MTPAIRRGRAILIWTAVLAAIAVPLAAAAASPQLAWRDPIYIAAGFAGVVALGLLLLQPMLIGGYLPGLSPHQRRRAHRWVGGLLLASVVAHVGGLWITSPPDVVDALLFVSPTPFSIWGVIAMWAIFATVLLVLLRRRLGLRPRTWRIGHTFLGLVIVAGTVIHGLLIEGTMETVSKVALSVFALAATFKAMLDLRVWAARGVSR